MQGAARREYRAYCQGLQRRSGALRSLPQGASPLACGRVAPLGNGSEPVGRSRTQSTALRGEDGPPRMAGLGVVCGTAHRQDATNSNGSKR